MLSHKGDSYTSSELARLIGVSSDTLRHYERKRVLSAPRRTANGYRQYSSQALERVLLVRRALAVGFTLDELARILEVRDRGDAPCKSVRAIAAAKLEDVERQLKSLLQLRKELRNILTEWDSLLTQSPPGKPALLLEALASRSISPKNNGALPKRRMSHFKKRKQ